MARNKLQVVNKSRSDKYNTSEPIKQEEKKTTKIKEKQIKVKEKRIKPKDEDEETIREIPPFVKKLIIFIIIVVAAFISYSMLIEPNLLQVKEYKIESNKISDSFHGLKVIQISDINYGTSFNETDLDRTITKINELKPDIVLFTGNLIDKNIKIDEKNKKTLITYLSKIETSLYKYAIYGKNDYNSTFEEIMKESNFTILDNETKLIYNEDETPIVLIGFNNNKKEQDYTIINNFIDEIDTSNYYKIVLTHSAEITDKLLVHNPDLILSGNTLGGIINPGFAKPLFLEENTKYYKDYYKLKDTKLYISNGLGTDESNMRFNNLPSITLFRIYKK